MHTKIALRYSDVSRIAAIGITRKTIRPTRPSPVEGKLMSDVYGILSLNIGRTVIYTNVIILKRCVYVILILSSQRSLVLDWD